MQNPVQIGGHAVGTGCPLLFIAGPCVIESIDQLRTVAEELVRLKEQSGYAFVFKASFDKANRTSLSSYRGPGLEEGLTMLQQISSEFHLPVTTDLRLARRDQADAILQVVLTDARERTAVIGVQSSKMVICAARTSVHCSFQNSVALAFLDKVQSIGAYS